MSGSIRQRDGKWEYRLDAGLDPITGRRFRPGRSGFETRADAEAALRLAETAHAKAQETRARAGASLTVLAYLTGWLTQIQGTVRPTTWTAYSIYIASHIAPSIGNVRLEELAAAHLNRLYAHLLEEGRARSSGGLSPKSVLNIHRMLHRALVPAVKSGLLPRDVLDNAIPPAVPDRQPACWSPYQFERFLDEIDGDRLRALWLLLATSDLNRRDLVSLRPEQVDLERGRLQHDGTWTPLEPTTADALRDYLPHREEQLAMLGRRASTLFMHPDGQRLNPHRITVWFHQLCDQAGLPRIRVKELRQISVAMRLTDGRENGRSGVRTGSTTDERPADQIAFPQVSGPFTL